MHIFLNVPCSIWFLKVSFNWLHSHSLLLWLSPVAPECGLSDPEALGWKPLISQPKPSARYFCTFVFSPSPPSPLSSTSVSAFNMCFHGDFVFNEGPCWASNKTKKATKKRLVSTPFHNPLPSQCLCLPASVRVSVISVTFLPLHLLSKASNLGSRGPWLVHLIVLATALPYTPATSNWAISAALKALGGLWSHHGVYGCGFGCTTL